MRENFWCCEVEGQGIGNLFAVYDDEIVNGLPQPKSIRPWQFATGKFPRAGRIPSIHMPRWASRITLEVTDVRVERVQDIGKDGSIARDILAEGIPQSAIDIQHKWFHPDDSPAIAFSQLWDSTNAKRGFDWESNPWVWVVGFILLELANEEA